MLQKAEPEMTVTKNGKTEAEETVEDEKPETEESTEQEAPDEAAEEETPESEETESPAETALNTFLDFIKTQPKAIQKQFEEHEAGLRKALKDERAKAKEGKTAVVELRKYKEAEEKARKAKMSDIEKAQSEAATAKQEAAEAKAELEATRRTTEVEKIATELKFLDPTDAEKLADLSKVTLKDGKYVGVREALEALLKSKPHLAGVAKPRSTIGTPPTNKNVKKPASKEDGARLPVVSL